MRKILAVITCILIFNQSRGQSDEPKSSLVGVFDGRTPCQYLIKLMTDQPMPDCTKLKWRLTLYKDSVSGHPSRYELISVFNEKANPRKGTWQIVKGARSNPEAIVYQLDPTSSQSLLLLKADDNILYFLDKNKELLVGNKDFSYTLNRIHKQ